MVNRIFAAERAIKTAEQRADAANARGDTAKAEQYRRRANGKRELLRRLNDQMDRKFARDRKRREAQEHLESARRARRSIAADRARAARHPKKKGGFWKWFLGT